MSDHISRTRKLVYGILSALLVFAAIEGIVRLAGIDTVVHNRFFVLNRALDYPDVFDKDHDLFWKFRPNQTITSQFFEGHTYHINSLGLRGYEIPPKSDKVRILALGNSCTFGWAVTLNETYVERLGQLLGDGYEVINGGVPGYTSYQGRKFFEQVLINLKPDYVLIMFGWNDHWAAANQIADKDQKLPPKLVISVQNFLAHFHAYRLLKRLFINSIDPDVSTLFDREKPVYRVSVTDFYQNLVSICQTAKEHNIQPVILTSPIPSAEYYLPLKSNYQSNLLLFHSLFNEMARQVEMESGAIVVDVADKFDQHDDLYDDVNHDFIHFNARGHGVTAEAIHKTIFTDTTETMN